MSNYQYCTSLPAYQEVKPKLNSKQLKVLDAIQQITEGTRAPVNDRMIAEYLGWPINTVTPRRLELSRAGKIYEVCKAQDWKTGRLTAFWKPCDKQIDMF